MNAGPAFEDLLRILNLRGCRPISVWTTGQGGFNGTIPFFRSGVWAVRAQVQDLVNTIVQPMNPGWLYMAIYMAPLSAGREFTPECLGLRSMYGCVVQGPIGTLRPKDPKTKYDDGIIGKQ